MRSILMVAGLATLVGGGWAVDAARQSANPPQPPANLPFQWDAKTIQSGLNFTLTTNIGDLDLFGEIAGGETYKDLLPHSFEIEAFGVRFRCVDLPTLIRIKEAAGRAKDYEAIAELRVLLEEKKRNG